MSKEDFIRQATELYTMQQDWYDHRSNPRESCDWMGSYDFRSAACINLALLGARPGGIEQMLTFVTTLNLRNNRADRRTMAASFIQQFGQLTVVGSGDQNDPAWNVENQIFICTGTPKAPDEPVHWGHWWIEIRNVNVPNSNVHGHLKLETVPGRGLSIRPGQALEDYTTSQELIDYGDNMVFYNLDVAIPVSGLSQFHYATLDNIYTAKLLISQASIPENEHEYLREGRFWERLVAMQSENGAQAERLRLNLPQNYQRPATRNNAVYTREYIATGNCVFGNRTIAGDLG